MFERSIRSSHIISPIPTTSATRPRSAVAASTMSAVMRLRRRATSSAQIPNGLHLAITWATQLAPTQRGQIVGTKGRLEIQVPFNPRRDQPTRIMIDDGRDLIGGGAEMEEFTPADQYQRQGDAFSRAIL